MKAADGALKANDGIWAFKLADIDISFHGDVAIVNHVAEVQFKSGDTLISDKLRTLDFTSTAKVHP
jgi:hypothetical protein